MFNKIIDRIVYTAGDWNAQLFRELKSRLQVKNIIVTILGSLLAQGTLLISFLLDLPTSPDSGTHRSSCQLSLSPLPFFSSGKKTCELVPLKSSNGELLWAVDVIDWPQWWGSLLITISGVIMMILVVMGVYLLTKDMRREKQHGTLDFVRLSPQSAASIFTGKLLGVPIFIYLAVGLAIPLQLVAGVGSRFGLINTLLWDLLWIVIALSFYLVAMLMTKIVPIVVAILAWIIQYFVSMTMRFFMNDTIHGSFKIICSESLIIGDVIYPLLFGIFCCGFMSYSIWLLTCHHYMNPHKTI